MPVYRGGRDEVRSALAGEARVALAAGAITLAIAVALAIWSLV